MTMPKDFRTILRNIPEDDVANFRKNNKQIKKNEDIEIRNLLSGDTWKFVYTAKHVHKNHHNLINNNRNNIEILFRHIDEEYFTLRCIVNALACKIAGEATAYPLETLSEKERCAALELLIFSCKFGYYFWDIDRKCDSNDIFDFFINHDSMPIPVLPYNNSSEQRARIITFSIALGSIFEVRESFIEEMKNKQFTFSMNSQFGDDNFEKKLKEIEIQHKMTDIGIEQILDGDPRQVDEVAKLVKMRKLVVPDNFHSDSTPARCIGLLMYDIMVSPGEPCDDIISRFKSSEKYREIETIRLFKKSDNAYISDKDNGTLKRWLKTTQKCIEKMAVLPFK